MAIGTGEAIVFAILRAEEFWEKSGGTPPHSVKERGSHGAFTLQNASRKKSLLLHSCFPE
jgi:hypothetical protein